MKAYIINPANGNKGVDIGPLLKILGLESKEVTYEKLEAIAEYETLREDNIDEKLYVIHKIVYKNNIYNFTVPLWCMLFKEHDCFTIESEMMDIAATGKTLKEAKMNFFEKFDSLYSYYNKLPKTKITYKILRVKNFLNSKVIRSFSNSCV